MVPNKSMHSMHSDDASVSLGNLSMDETAGGAAVDDADTIDTRKFQSAAINLLTSSKHTLEKTLLKMYRRTISKGASVSEESLANGIEFYRSGPPLAGTMSTSLSVDSSASLMWSAFQLFAQRLDGADRATPMTSPLGRSHSHGDGAGDPLQGVSVEEDLAAAGIPVSKLGKAMQRIVYWVTREHVVEVAHSFGLLDDEGSTAMRYIGWPEFTVFASRVLETMPPLPNGAGRDDKFRQHGTKSAPALLGGSPQHQHQQQGQRRYTQHVALSGAMPSQHVPLGKHLQKGTIHLSSLSALPGLNAHRNYAKEEIVDIFRREERYKRKQEKARAAAAPAMGDAVDAAGSQASATASKTSFANTGGGNLPTDPLEKLRRPLLKQQVHELVNIGDAYATKWNAMKARRDARYEGEERRLARAEMRMTLNRLVVIAERSNLHKVLADQSNNIEQVMINERNAILHQEVDEVKENIRRNRAAEKELKARNSAALRQALSSSTVAAQAALEHEKAMKAALKEAEVWQLREDSTTKYEPPAELVEQKSTAKRQADFDAARMAIKTNFEQTMDERIKSYTIGKQEAILKASMKGAAITVLPSPGPDLFEEPLVERSRSKGALLPRFVDSVMSTPDDWKLSVNVAKRLMLSPQQGKQTQPQLSTPAQQAQEFISQQQQMMLLQQRAAALSGGGGAKPPSPKKAVMIPPDASAITVYYHDPPAAHTAFYDDFDDEASAHSTTTRADPDFRV